MPETSLCGLSGAEVLALPSDSERRWHLACVRGGFERSCEEQAPDYQLTPCVPLTLRVYERQRHGHPVAPERRPVALFPRYVPLHGSDAALAEMRHDLRVRGVVQDVLGISHQTRFATQLAAVVDGLEALTRPQAPFSPGDHVRVGHGAMLGVRGRVVDDGRGGISLELLLMGRWMPASNVPWDYLEQGDGESDIAADNLRRQAPRRRQRLNQAATDFRR